MLHTIRLSALIILLASAGLQAQKVPGYLGKRFSIGYSGQYAITLNGANYIRDQEENPDPNGFSFFEDAELSPAIQATHFLLGEYTLNKRYSLTMGLGYNRSYFGAADLNRLDQDMMLNREIVSRPARHQVNSLQLAMGIRAYRALYAPVGSFVEFNLAIQAATVKDFELVYEEANQMETVQFDPATAYAPIFGLKFGRARMLTEQLRLEYFGAFAFQYPGFTRSKTFFFSGDVDYEDFPPSITMGDTPETDDYFKAEANARTFVNNFIYVGITVAFMP